MLERWPCYHVAQLTTTVTTLRADMHVIGERGTNNAFDYSIFHTVYNINFCGSGAETDL